MNLTAKLHYEDGSYWAEVKELPGCFATGDTLDELTDALRDTVRVYLADDGEELSGEPVRIDELKLVA
ncbi:MAG TPA: type II toxin-antitoxin system HicB family antitoxin [Thermoleophilaceae bacterium]|jgi:predicted RNase H-like HicB family nuclease